MAVQSPIMFHSEGPLPISESSHRGGSEARRNIQSEPSEGGDDLNF